MTQKAVDRLVVVQQVVSRQLRQREAARQLGLSVQQIKRLVVRYRAEGPSGLVSRASVDAPATPCPTPFARRCWDWSAPTIPTSAPRWPARSWPPTTGTSSLPRRCASG